MVLKITNEQIGDCEEDRKPNHYVPERRIFGRDGVDRMVDLVVNDVGRKRILTQSSEKPELNSSQVTKRNKQRVNEQRKARRKESKR